MRNRLSVLGLVIFCAAGCSSVDILQPADGSSFTQGQTITFEGRVTRSSQTGGANRSNDLEWSSSLNGNLGTGSTVSTSSLNVGTHTVTATWPAGNCDDDITITVNP